MNFYNQYIKLIYLFLAVLMFYNPLTWAQRKSGGGVAKTANVGYAKFAASAESYSGDKNKSISNAGTGYGGEIGVDAGYNMFRYYAKLKLYSASGSQNLMDSTVEIRTNFSLLQIAPEIGASFYPVGRSDRGLNLYFFGGGLFSMNMLELKPISNVATGAAVTTFTKLQTKQQGFGYGLAGGIGFEIAMGGNKTSKKMIYGEVGVKQSTAKLADRDDFQINSLFFTVGFGL